MTDIVLGIRLKADGSDLVGQVRVSKDALKELREETGKNTSEAAKLNQEHQNMARTMSENANKIGAYSAGWNLLTNAITGAIGAAKDYIKDSAMLAARHETLGAVMAVVGRNAGYSAQQMNDAAEAIRASGITMIQSREAAVKLAQAQIDLSLASQLARGAQDAAKIANIDSSEALERMIHGIVSGQTEVLRAMGINVNFEASYKSLAKQLGVNTDQLTEQEKVQARATVTLQGLTTIQGVYTTSLETTGGRLQSLKRYEEDLKTIRGEVWNEALQIAVDAYAKSLKGANDEARKLSHEGSLKEWGRDVIDVMAFVADAVDGVVRVMQLAGAHIATIIAGVETAAKIAYAANPARGGALWNAGEISGALSQFQGVRGAADANIEAILGRSTYRGQVAAQRAGQDASAAQRESILAFTGEPSVARPAAGPRPAGTAKGGVQNPYESMARQLDQEALRLAGELNSTQKLENDLLHMGAAARAKMTAAEVESLRVKAAANDATKRAAEALEAEAKAYEVTQAANAAGAAQLAAFNATQADTLNQTKFETELLGIHGKTQEETTALREKAVAMRKIENDFTRASIKLEGEENAMYALRLRSAEMIRDQQKQALSTAMDARSAAREAEAEQKKSLEEFSTLWSTVESTGKTVFTNLLGHGKSAADGIGKAIKASVIDLLYQLTARKWIISLGTSVAGSLGLGTAATAANAASGGGGGGIGDLLGLGNSVSNLFGGSGMFGGAVNLAGNTLAGASWLGTGSMFGSVGGAELAGLAALEGGGALAGGAAAGAGIASAIPYIGWAIAAYSLLSGGFGGGGTPAVLTSKDMPAGMVGYGAGLTGDVYGNDSNQGYRWVGEHAQNIWATEINGLYDEIAKLGTQLGYDTSNIRSLTATVSSQIPDGSDYGAAFPGIMAQVSDQIARQLIPNLDKLAQAGESATQTLARLAMELRQAKLGEIFSLMGGAIALQDQTRDLWLSDLSPLTATERFNASNAKYAELLGKAPSDARAMAELGAFTRSNLSEAASYYGTSTPEYRALFEGRQADVGNLVTDTLTEQSIQFAEMGLTMKDIAANTKDLDTRIAAALQSAIDAWQAAQALIAQSNTTQIVTAVNSTAQQTAFVLASAASAEMNRGLAEDRASGDE